MATESVLRVTVCFSRNARECAERVLHLPPGSRLIDAVRGSSLLAAMPDAEVDALQTGVWGRKQTPDYPLRDGDRVELYRPLKVDPKVARRERFTRQGAGTTGLFAKRRAGAKSGY
jgi:putative ubiquitin-RnfH superfamily antitoxin RatB of RatAB toxin-antitoxin module